MDADKSLESKLREILGYLNTLGVNIQKRTQHLLDNRINESYLSSVKNLEKVVEKVNTICDLSVASLQKVNNGVKVTVKNGKSRLRSKESREGSSSQQKTHKKSDFGDINRSCTSSSHTTEKSETDKIKKIESKKKKTLVGNVDIYLPNEVVLNNYTQCFVKLSSEDSNAVLKFTPLKKISPKKEKDDSKREDNLDGSDHSKYLSSKGKHKFRIKSRPTTNHHTPEKMDSQSEENSSKCDSVEKTNEISDRKSNKPYSRIVCNNSSSEDDTKPCVNNKSESINNEKSSSRNNSLSENKTDTLESSNLSNECNDSKSAKSESSLEKTMKESNEKSRNNLFSSLTDTSRSEEMKSEQIKEGEEESISEDHEREIQSVSSDKLPDVSQSIAARDSDKIDAEKIRKHSSKKHKRSEKDRYHSSKSKKHDVKLSTKEKKRHKTDAEKSELVPNEIPSNDVDHLKEDIINSKSVELTDAVDIPNLKSVETMDAVDNRQEDIINSNSVELTDPVDIPNLKSIQPTSDVDHRQEDIINSNSVELTDPVDIPNLKSVETTDAVDNRKEDIPNLKSIQPTSDVDHRQEDISNSKSIETSDVVDHGKEDIINSNSVELTDTVDIPNLKSVETTDAVDNRQEDIPNLKSIQPTSDVDHRQEVILNSKSVETSDHGQEDIQNSKSIETNESDADHRHEGIPNSKSAETRDHLQEVIPNLKSAETLDDFNSLKEEVLSSKSESDNLTESVPMFKSVEMSDASKNDQEHRKKKALKLKKIGVGDLGKKKSQDTESNKNSVSDLEKKSNKKSSILDLVLGNDESCNNIINQPEEMDKNDQEEDTESVGNLSTVLDMCNKIIADVSSLSKELEDDSSEKAGKEVQQDRSDSKQVEDGENTCQSPPFYPSQYEGCGHFNDANISKDNLLIENADEIDVSEKDPSGDKSKNPTLMCVDIRKLLSSAIKECDSSTILKSPSKKPKNVTFLDKLVIKKPKSNQDSPIPTVNASPASILMNNDSKYANCWNNSSAIELSDSDDSDVSNTNRELLKTIKNKILQGQSNTSVTLTRDSFYSDKYTGSLPKCHGIKRAYNEHGKLIFCQRQKKLIEDAKKSVLGSSSSDEDLIEPIRKKLLENSSGSGNDSDSESVDVVRVQRKKKKFSRKRRRKDDSDSDFNMKDILKFSKSKVRRKHFLSEESSQDKLENDSTDDEMGRSARLKQREAPAAFTQSKKERNESDSSSSSSLKNNSPKTTNETVKESKLMKTSVNGDVKSSSDTDQSSTTDSSTKPKNTIKPSKPDIPLSEKIKDDLLQEESSSSAQETDSAKMNGKNKKSPTNEEIKKVLIVDSDEEEEEEEDDDDDVVECDNDDESSSKRPGSTINLDTDSDDSIRVPRIKNRKAENGKKGKNEHLEKEDKSGNESNESEVFAPAKRKRKPKKKSSSSGSEDDNSQDSDSTEKKTKRKRIKKMSGDDDSSGDDGSEEENNKKGRKNIRALKKTSHLDSATREAAKKERERIARIAERQKLYNESMFDESGKPEEIAKLDKVVLDFDPKTREPIIALDKGLVQKLKPHQANGIKFMWNACFESVKQINSGKGSGCILAHCMGLGKTLQVVTLVHTLLLHREQTKVERVLVVCPLSTVLNWVNEFNMWLEHAEAKEEINIFELSRYKQNHERAYQLKEWLECGGVCILGYDMFRNLSADNPKKFRKAQLSSFQKSLVDPGPDLVVCDEGHLLKNEKTSLSQSMNRVKTLRRIVLTGTPLQNNLKEYYCMVQFVKPNLLGKYSEYLNRFVNPITNGQYTNSTDQDIKLMKRRSHVLHKMLDGAVQRRDYAVLAPFLPPKNEYVLFISLTEIQIKLYRHYLENYSRRPNPEKKTTPSLFSDFQSLQRIWTHPLVLKANSERYELMLQKKRDKEEEEESEGSLVDFIDDEEDTSTPEESSISESEESDESDKPRKRNKNKKNNSKAKPKRVTRATAASQVKEEGEIEDEIVEVKNEENKVENPTEWWMSLCSEDELNDIRHSNKLLLLLDILKECEAIGDKVLVFSQSLYSLDLIEQFLSKIDEATQKGSPEEHLGGHSGSWSQGLDYFRLDGSTSCENRSIWCKAFNREDNPRARLFLISTRAGGLGINLVAANRVVIFDVSWNPSHDVQSIFRVYRFGQKKPCYIYRFLALGTMEEKIYERQVTKQAISKRVIDEQQIDRHYTESDLAELYVFCPEPEGQREVPNLPKDRLFADILKNHDTVIYKYHEHDSLLENKEEETLSEEERKAAWEDYENEKKRPPQSFAGANWLLMQQQQQQQQMTINALQAVLRQDYPSLTEQQITAMIPAILQQMHVNGDAAFTQKLTAMMAAQNNMLTSQMPGYKYNPNLMAQSMMMNPGGMGVGIRNPLYQQVWQQQQQQLQLQRLQQQQALQTNLKYYAGGLGSRDLMDMAAIQQQQRALLLGNALQPPSTRGRPPKTILRPPRPISTSEIVDLDSE